MKGGTALNLFVQDMPRLSVDIDLVFTDHRLLRKEAHASIPLTTFIASAAAPVEKGDTRPTE